MRPVHAIFEEKADAFPDHPAVEAGGSVIAYGALNRNANQLAHLLTDLGVEKETIVAVLMPPGVELITTVLAVFKAGGVYLPLDIDFPAGRFRQIFSRTFHGIIVTTAEWQAATEALLGDVDADARVVVLGAGQPPRVEGYGAKAPAGTRPGGNGYATGNPGVVTEPNDSSYIFYTSGTTGEGKAILGCHRGLAHFINWELGEFALTAQCRVSQLAQVTFDASLRDIFVPLCAGGTLCIPPANARSNPARLVEWLEQSAVSLVHCVPSLFRLITNELKTQSPGVPRLVHLRYLLMAGEVLRAKDVLAWRAAAGEHVTLVNLYGTSETTMAKTFHRIGEVGEHTAPVIHAGKPIADTFVAIINRGNLCRIGEIGEIYIKTPYATKGYYNDPALTDQVFVQNPLVSDRKDIVHKTGDLGRYLGDRSIEVLGRLDNQVKVNGIRIELGEVEQAMLRVEGVSEALAVARSNREEENELVGYYTGVALSSEHFRTRLLPHLAPHSIPTYFVWLEKFPLTLNGKVNKKALPLPGAFVVKDSEYVAPEGEVEERLETIWKELLGLQRIGTSAVFGNIGGHSLKAVQLISRIYREFDVELHLADVFRNPTIKAMAHLIAGKKPVGYAGIPAGERQPYHPLSYAQRRLWLSEQNEQHKVDYTMFHAYAFTGVVDAGCLGRAFEALVERHESLRTTYAVVEGAPVQKISPFVRGGDFQMARIDLRRAANNREIADALIEEEAAAPFHLAHGPLIRAKLIRVEDEKYFFTLALHHIVADGWSLGVIFREMLQGYHAYREGREPALAPLRIQYRDYAAWHNARLSEEKLAADTAFWREYLGPEVPALQLPYDYPKPASSAAGDVANVSFGRDLTADLHQVCRGSGVSLFVVLAAALSELFYYYQPDQAIGFGVPVAGRKHPELENQVGYYLNLVVLKSHVGEQQRFKDLVDQIQRDFLRISAHDDFPFELLVGKLNAGRRTGNAALINASLDFHHFNLADAGQAPGQNAFGISTVITNFKSKGKFDLDFVFSADDGSLSLNLYYNTALFKPATISSLLEKVKLILQESAADPLVTSAHLRELLHQHEKNRVSLEKDHSRASRFERLMQLKAGKTPLGKT